MSLGIARRRAYAAGSSGGGPFDPSSLSDLVAWWKADALSLSDGASVASWVDSSGDSNPLIGGATEPIFHIDEDGSLPGVLFTASAHSGMTCTPLALPGTGWAVCFAFKPIPSSDGYGAILTQGAASGLWYRGGSRQMDYYHGGDHPSTTAITENAVHRYLVINDGTDVHFTLDGSADGTASGAGAGLAADHVGTDPSNDSANMELFEMFAVSRALTSPEQAEVVTYLDRW